MAILEDDIKLLKSRVMADTNDGGGQMTGIVVQDGLSNNVFPDTSDLDHAGGRVQMRKMFAVGHSDDTDTILGANVIVADAPNDPLVHCAIMKTAGWADERAVAKDYIERYLVKGPRLGPKIYDMHYAGAMQLRLITFAPGIAFPQGGEAVALVNPDGTEQYVRILTLTMTTENVVLGTSGSTVNYAQAYVGTCQLGQALKFDVYGPPTQPVVTEDAYAKVFSTNPSSGTQFYGIKKLGADVEVGDVSVTVDGGIYTPLVPAATIETPIVDQFPLRSVSALAKTAFDSVILTAATVTLAPGKVLTFPSPIEPGSLSFTHGSTLFTDSGASALKQGTTVVGVIDYRQGLVTMLASSPSFGAGTLTPTYKPASLVSAVSFSSSLTITLANQGTAFVNIFNPLPAPGSLTISYMVQGRWYELKDNMTGKLEGSDSSYGVGSISYTTGSMALTLGALPDIGSSILAQWGDSKTGKAVPTENLPTKFGMRVQIHPAAVGVGSDLAWSANGADYTATISSDGTLSGDATGLFAEGALSFFPSHFPDTGIEVVSQKALDTYSAYTISGSTMTLTGGSGAVAKGTFRCTALVTYPADVIGHDHYLNGAYGTTLFDVDGVVYIKYAADGSLLGSQFTTNIVEVGTINYATGVVSFITFNPSVLMPIAQVVQNPYWNGSSNYVTRSEYMTDYRVLPFSLGTAFYARGTVSSISESVTPGPWKASIDTTGFVLSDGIAMFKLGSDVYTGNAGSLVRGWNVNTGAPVQAAVGVLDSSGVITLQDSAIPTNNVNTIVWTMANTNQGASSMTQGIFRTATAPLKTGVFQIDHEENTGTGNDAGVISGGNFTGTIDYQRGIVKWEAHVAYWTTTIYPPPIPNYTVAHGKLVDPRNLSYNAVFLQYLPLDADILGLETARLPLDGRVPIFRQGDFVVVHHTQSANFVNPVVKGTDYDLGRERIASVRVKDLLGVTVPSTKYTHDLDAGTLTFKTDTDLSMYTQPFRQENRIEDILKCSVVDISGKLTFQRSLTHDFPADESYVSSVLAFGDLFARAFNFFQQATFTEWSDEPASSIIANYNEGTYPPVVTNRGAIRERWALIFTSSTSFRIVGETVGIIGTGNTGNDCSPMNPAVGVPFWTLLAAGFGDGWAVGNVLRFDTDACGSPFWTVRTVLQGPPTLLSDSFTLGWRANVDRP